MIMKNNKEVGFKYKNILPNEYQRIEYIESTGTGSGYGKQYINTGFVPSPSGFKVNVIFSQSSTNYNTGCFVYGAYDSTNGYKPSLYVYASTRKLGVYSNSGGLNTNITSELDTENDVTITTSGSSVTYNINGATGTITNSYNPLDNETPITICTSYVGNTYILRCRIRRFRVYDENNVLVRDMFPCYRKSDNKTGMYDLITKTFYSNLGNVEFDTGNNLDTIDKVYHGTDLVFEQGFTREQEGVPPITTTKQTIGKDLKDYRIYGKTETGTLPVYYQQVEYIENTGSSYINTGLIGKPGYTIETQLNYSELATGSYQYFAGYAYTGSADRIYYIRLANTSANLGYTYGSDNTGTTAYTTLNTNTWYKFKSTMAGGLQELYLDDVLLGGTTKDALSYDADNPKYIYMFVSQYVNSTNGPTKAKCRYAKWYDENNNLIRDYVPCYRKSDGEIGMYDRVEGKFYANMGSGSFSKGNDVNETPLIDKEVPIYGVGEKTKNMINVPKDYTFTGYPNLNSLIDMNKIELGVEYKVVWSGSTKGSTYYPAMNLGGNVGWLQTMGPDGGSKTFTYTTLPTNIYIYANGGNAARSAGVTSSVQGLMFIKSSDTTDYEPYGYKIPVMINSKNLLPYPYKSSTLNGITFSSNNGRLKITGTASATFWGNVCTFTLPAGQYTFVENSNLSAISGHSVQLGSSGTSILNVTVESSRSNDFIINKDTDITMSFRFTSGSTIANEELELMIIKKGDSTSFAKYEPPTNIYLDKPMYKVGDKTDYVDFKNKKLYRNIQEQIITGQEAWEGGTDFFRFKISNSNIIDGDVAVTDQYCNYAEAKIVTVSGSEIGASVYYSSGLGGTYFRIRPSSSIGSIQNFKTLMQQYYANGHPLRAYFPLSTTTSETIDLPDIPSLKNTTTTYKVTSGVNPSNMYIKYKGK